MTASSEKDIETAEHVDRREDGSPVGNPKNKITPKFFMTMLGLAITFVLAEATPLFLVTCFTIIAYDLGSIDHVIWILVTPYISTGAIAPFVGNLSDLLGRRGIILASLVVSIAAYAIQGAAPNFACYIVGAALNGVALGIQLLTVVAAASELVPVSKRGLTIGYIVLGFLPFAPASLYGQLLAEYTWRYIYLFLGIWSVLAMVVLFIWYRPAPRPNSEGLTKRQLLKRIDYVGCLLSVLGVVLFLVGINWGGLDYPWNSRQVICMLVFGVVTLIIFGLYERFWTPYPMFPSRLIQHMRHFICVSILCLVSGINFVPLTVFWTVQTFSVYGASFFQAGIWLLPLGFCIAGGAIIGAVFITVFKKHIQWVLLLFCIMQTVGIACLSIVDPDNVNSVWPAMVFALVGVGAVLLPSQVVFSIISPDDLIGTSVALSVVIRMIGQVIGKSMLYNIFTNEVKKNAPLIIAQPAIAAGFTSVERIELLVTTMTAGPLSHYLALFPEINTPEKLDAIVAAGHQIFAKSFPLLYYVSIPFGVLSVFSCLGLWGIERFITDRVAVLA